MTCMHFCYLVSAALMTLPAPAFSQSENCPPEGVRIGYLDIGANYHGGRGIDVDLLKTLAQSAGCQISHEAVMPRLRSIRLLENGDLNVLPSIALTPERAALGYALHYQVSKNMVVLDKRFKPLPAEQLGQSADIVWGVIRGYIYSPQQHGFLERQRTRNKIVEANDTRDLFRMLDKKLVHAILAHPLVLAQNLNGNRAEDIVHVYDGFPSDQPLQGVILLSRKSFSHSAAMRWSKALEKMQKNGSLMQLYQRHLGPNLVRHLMPDRVGLHDTVAAISE